MSENEGVEVPDSPTGDSGETPVAEAPAETTDVSSETTSSPDAGAEQQAVPYDRFSEVIKERNSLKAEYEQSRQREAQIQQQLMAMWDAQQRQAQESQQYAARQRQSQEEGQLDPTQRAVLELSRKHQMIEQQLGAERQQRAVERLKSEVGAAIAKYPVAKEFEAEIVSRKWMNPDQPAEAIAKAIHDRTEAMFTERQKTWIASKTTAAVANKGVVKAGQPPSTAKRPLQNFAQANAAAAALLRGRRGK